MIILIVGLILFLGVHAVRIVAPGWRDAQIARAEGRFKGLYSLISAIGLVLIVWGYGAARPATVFYFALPGWATHLASLLIALGFIGIAAAYVPRGRIAAYLRHPMVTGVALWALGHLLVNGDLVSLILFGVFLVWAVVDRISAGRRPDPQAPAGPVINDVIAVVVGLAFTAIFALWLHGPLIGVAPFG